MHHDPRISHRRVLRWVNLAELFKVGSLLEGGVSRYLAFAQALFIRAYVALSFLGLLDFLQHD